jgi:hypothetical protein
MFLTLGVVLLVLDDLEEDENIQDDAEKIATDMLQKVLVDTIASYKQFKQTR